MTSAANQDLSDNIVLTDFYIKFTTQVSLTGHPKIVVNFTDVNGYIDPLWYKISASQASS